MGKKQKDIYFMTGDSYENIMNNPGLEGYKSRDINVLILDDPVDSFWTSSTPLYKEKSFKSVTKGLDDLDSFDSKKEKDNKKENKSIDPLIVLLKEQLKDKVKDVRISSRLTDSAVCLVGDDNAMDPHLEKILQQHNQLNQQLSLKILEINSDHKLIKKMAKMCTKKEEISEINKIATMLYEQSKILDGEKPSDPARFSRDLIDVIYSSVK